MQTAVRDIVDIVILGNSQMDFPWPYGNVYRVEPSVPSLSVAMHQLAVTNSDACVFWDSAFSLPDFETIQSFLRSSSDIWHAGLRLGLIGQPGLLDFVHPTWMYHRDPHPETEAISWRLSLRCCLIKTSVLRHFGGIRPDFETVEAASLELGYRFLKAGVIMRHVPQMLSKGDAPVQHIPFGDQWRFLLQCAGRKWALWAITRSLLTRNVNIKDFVPNLMRVITTKVQRKDTPFLRPLPLNQNDVSGFRVSVLIPTLNRYSYLRRLLSQLRNQTVPPAEIIIVDQTPEGKRDLCIARDYSDLPLNISYKQNPGQCSARNEGLRRATGTHILFLDDDEEIPPDLIENHALCLQRFQADVSSGAVNDDATLPEYFRHIRCADVFPTGNTMIRYDALRKSGLFDLAYERGDREDGDLGMRVYLSGSLMIFNPAIRVIHHHAAEGGLRTHGAGMTTYVQSRKKIMHRKIPSSNEIYYYNRYFTELQSRERILLSAFGTLSLHGHFLKRALKMIVGVLFLPDTFLRLKRNARQAAQMRTEIPHLTDRIEE